MRCVIVAAIAHRGLLGLVNFACGHWVRKNPYLFRDTMFKLIGSTNLEYKELTAQQAKSAA